MMRIFLIGILCIYYSECVAKEDNDSVSAKHEKILAEHKAKVSLENESSKPHSWSGTYSEKAGRDSHREILISPQNNFVYSFRGGLGLYAMAYGRARKENERIILTIEYEYRVDELKKLSDEFYFIRWKDRYYLISCIGIIQFCNEVNSGGHVLGLFKTDLRDTENKKELPVVPRKYDSYILKSPLEASILFAGKTTQKKNRYSSWRETSVILDMGEKDGLRKGMKLFVYDPPPGLLSFETRELTIFELDSDQSKGILEQNVLKGPRKKQSTPRKGWKVSTRHPSYRN